MVTARRPLYKPNVPEFMEEPSSSLNNESGFYTNHFFDIPFVTKSCNRKRHKDISYGLAPLKGVKPVRDKGGFRIDESTVPPNLLPPIPQTIIKPKH